MSQEKKPKIIELSKCCNAYESDKSYNDCLDDQITHLLSIKKEIESL